VRALLAKHDTALSYLSLRQIRYFLAVAEARHFTRAAAKAGGRFYSAHSHSIVRGYINHLNLLQKIFFRPITTGPGPVRKLHC
jgi:hypothetical protein